MLLTVDVGNTQTTLGLFDEGGELVVQWRMATDRTDTADELHERLFGYFLMLGMKMESVTDVAISSVVPILSQQWSYMMTNVLKAEDVLMVDATRDCGIAVGIPDPRQVGADRIANAVAARDSYGPSTIVVDFGTATNIDVVDKTGTFRGGVIMPGLLLSANSLFERAAKLSSVPLVAPEHALGVSTECAVQSGIVARPVPPRGWWPASSLSSGSQTRRSSARADSPRRSPVRPTCLTPSTQTSPYEASTASGATAPRSARRASRRAQKPGIATRPSASGRRASPAARRSRP